MEEYVGTTVAELAVKIEGDSVDLEYDAAGRSVIVASSGDTLYLEVLSYLDSYDIPVSMFDGEGWLSEDAKTKLEAYLNEACGEEGRLSEDPGIDPNFEYVVPLNRYEDSDAGAFFNAPDGRGHEIVAAVLDATETLTFMARI